MSVKNINSLKYFLDRWEMVDPEYNYTVPYHDSIDPHFTSLPTFVAEFHECKVNTCPLLITRENKLITEYVWTLTHKSRHKPHKSHSMWKEWGDDINIQLPPVTESFNEAHTYVWLPVDDDSKNNPWHIWIDVISKFRLMEKRWSTNFSRYCYILAQHSPYFEKVCKTLFPDVKIVVMPKGSTLQNSCKSARTNIILMPGVGGILMPEDGAILLLEASIEFKMITGEAGSCFQA